MVARNTNLKKQDGILILLRLEPQLSLRVSLAVLTALI